MAERVTVALPVYRRLEYLPGVLESIAAQDYPEIELLVSDNGNNGPGLEELVARHCDMPYRFRRNETSVPLAEHFNQLVEAARGEYFLVISDDDEIAPGFVSALVAALEAGPEIGAALPRLEIMDAEGRTVPRRREKPEPPRVMTDEEFLRIWCHSEYDFICFVTNLARTEEVRAAGGYPDWPRGNYSDNALLLKLVLGRNVAFVPDALFRYRVYETSTGLSASYRDLATSSRGFLRFLGRDPALREYARERPERWRKLRDWLVEMTWRTYRWRWKSMYRRRLSGPEWVRAAFAMPFIPEYYSAVTSHLVKVGLSRAKQMVLRGVRAAGIL